MHDASFSLMSSNTDLDPIHAVLEFLHECQSITLIPRGFTEEEISDNREVATDMSSSTPKPIKDATLAVKLRTLTHSYVLDSWGDDGSNGRLSFKFWAGRSQGKSIVTKMLTAIKKIPHSTIPDICRDPFRFKSNFRGGFNFDFRSTGDALSFGFSLEDAKISLVGYPIAEILSVVGIQNARPHLVSRNPQSLMYRYRVSSQSMPVALHRAVLGGHDIGLPSIPFTMHVGFSGKTKIIKRVLEEQ